MGPCSAIRHGDWKLIYYHDGPRLALYNLAVDIREEKDLAGREPAQLRELARELGEYLRRVRAPMPMVKATQEPVPWPDDHVDAA
jgi:arylsulfatase A-like enzyme